MRGLLPASNARSLPRRIQLERYMSANTDERRDNPIPLDSAVIRILIVDDHLMVRRGIRTILSSQPDMTVVGEAENGRDGVELAETLSPDIVIIDLQMPVMDGIAAMTEIRRKVPAARIVALTTYVGDDHAVRATRAGAVGYLLKTTLSRELTDAVRIVHGGGQYLAEEIARQVALHAEDDRLNDREREILTLASSGYSNKRIAARLDLSENTVKGYMTLMFAKLGAADRTHAVTIAVRRGMIEL